LSTVSEATSRAIYNDALAAYQDTAHPCHRFVRLQEGIPRAQWQLPEPFNGWSANAGLALLALNPSYDPTEDVPRIGTGFQEWDRYYRRRFDASSWGPGTLYGRYQRLGEIALGPSFRLGRDALVLEAVRYKSAGGAGCQEPQVLEHEIELTRRLLIDIRPKVILGQGRALYELARLLPELRSELEREGWRITPLEGRLLKMRSPFGPDLIVVPSRHLMGARGMTTAHRRRVGETLGFALGR
jgi:hypothetical protein